MSRFRALGLKRTHYNLIEFEHWTVQVQREKKHAPLGVAILLDVGFSARHKVNFA
jgi:hypothetical protein